MAGKRPSNTIPRIVELADRLEADIRRKKLQPGDTYLTTQQAASLLGVGGSSANRALQLLEKRRVIVRRQRIGAVIAERELASQTSICRVRFVVHERYLRTEGIGADGILLGLQEKLPEASVHLCYLEPGREESQVSELVEQSIANDITDGFILVRTTPGVQRMIAESGLPAVVHGTRYPSIERLPSIDRNHGQAARLIADYLRSRGRTRFAYLNRQKVLPGDHLVLDQLHKILDPSSLVERYLPPDDRVIEAAAEELLEARFVPDAWICQTERVANSVAAMVHRHGFSPGKEVDIVVGTYYPTPGVPARFPYVDTESDSKAIGRLLGDALAALSKGQESEDVQIPVELIVPEE
jgi:DNA-binding LacI/PurR family transcriptional regulator